MKKLNFIKALVIICSTVLFAVSCDDEKKPDVSVEGVTISPERTTLNIGDEITLEVNVLPAEATNKEYSLSLSRDGVVELDGNVVKALAPGKVTVTAITVENAKTAIASIEVIKEEDPGPGPGPGPDPDNTKFEFDITVDGIDVTIDITPSTDSLYFCDIYPVWMAENPILGGFNPQGMTQAYIDEMLNSGMALEDICYSGPHSLVYLHNGEYILEKSEDYYVYVVTVTEDGYASSNVTIGNFKTEERGSYEGEENILTLEVTGEVAAIDVVTTATTDEEYYIVCMEENEYNSQFSVSMDKEIMGSLFFHCAGMSDFIKIDADYKVSGDQNITIEGLKSGVSYVVVAFGYAYEQEEGADYPSINQNTTPLYKETVKTK